jgi:hypothetical protein
MLAVSPAGMGQERSVSTLHVDPAFDADALHEAVFVGDLVLLTQVEAVTELVGYARASLAALFDPHRPEEAHEHLTPEEMAPILGRWKPAFIHDPEAQRLVKAIIVAAGLDPDRTYMDLPKPRTSFPVGHLTTGIAFAFPWHRDTWYAAPRQQVNWWLPVFDVRRENAMAFDVAQFGRAVPNDSAQFDYYRINEQRRTTATQVKTEVQSRPQAIDHDVAHELVVLPRPGQVLLFSGDHLHASIPNTSGRSRYSIDFRTIDRSCVERGRGAPAVDVECTGTALRDFLNVASRERLDESLVRSVAGDPPEGAVLVFDPADAVDGPAASR